MESGLVPDWESGAEFCAESSAESGAKSEPELGAIEGEVGVGLGHGLRDGQAVGSEDGFGERKVYAMKSLCVTQPRDSRRRLTLNPRRESRIRPELGIGLGKKR